MSNETIAGCPCSDYENTVDKDINEKSKRVSITQGTCRVGDRVRLIHIGCGNSKNLQGCKGTVTGIDIYGAVRVQLDDGIAYIIFPSEDEFEIMVPTLVTMRLPDGTEESKAFDSKDDAVAYVCSIKSTCNVEDWGKLNIRYRYKN